MRRKKNLRSLNTAALLIAATIFACGGDPLGPDGRVQVTRAPDSFLLQMWDLADATDTRSYNWQNTGTQAAIDILLLPCSGVALLVIKDDAGTVVHREDILDDNDTDSAVGVAGQWSIEIQLQDVNCSLAVSVVRAS